jgi:uridine phosphorylase
VSRAVPRRLRPKTELAADAILVGDPGRSLLLAQELLVEPKMSNHARGLWGYSGRTPAGDELTIQSTGMGGPSAALVLADLAKLGVRRAVRVGTCAAVAERAKLGELLLPSAALVGGGSAASFGLASGESVGPDRALLDELTRAFGGDEAKARMATVTSLDHLPRESDELPEEAVAVDMQTVAVLARAAELALAAAAVLAVSEAGEERLDDESLAAAAVDAGAGAALALSKL